MKRYIIFLFAALAFTACSDDYDVDTRVFTCGERLWYRYIPDKPFKNPNSWEKIDFTPDGRYYWGGKTEGKPIEVGLWAMNGDILQFVPVRSWEDSNDYFDDYVDDYSWATTEHMSRMKHEELRRYRCEVHEGPLDGVSLDTLFLYEYIQTERAYSDTPLVFVNYTRYWV